MKDVDDALRQFGVRIGLPSLKLNSDGICELTVGDGLEIFIEKTSRPNDLRLNGRVGTPQSSGSEVMRALLVANYGGHGTGSAAHSIDPVSGEVVLSQLIDVSANDIEGFAGAVDTFLRYLKFWVGYLPTLGPDTAASPPIESADFSLIRI